MAEPAKLRLVRCPKCQNLLPEVPDYSVYQCGGCGAVLRANRGDGEGEKTAERSCEEKVSIASEKPGALMEKSEDFKGKEALYRVENVWNDTDGNSEVIADRCGDGSKGLGDKGIVEEDMLKKNEMGNGHLEPRGDEVKTHNENGNESRSSGRAFRQRMDRGEDEGFGRTRRGDAEGLRFLSTNYAGEGSSKCHWNCNFENETILKNENCRSRSNRVEYKEVDREAILRKLDELKDQLSRTCDSDDAKEKNSLDQRIVHPEPCVDSDEWLHDRPFGVCKKSRELRHQNKHSSRPHYSDHYNGSFPVVDGHGMNVPGYHPLMHSSNQHPGVEDYFGSLKTRTPSQQMTRRHQHQHQSWHPKFSTHHISPRKDPYEPQSFSPTFDRFSCSCYQCRVKQQHVSRKMPSSAYNSIRLPQVGNESMTHHHEVPGSFGSQVYHSRICNANSTSSYNLEAHARWPNDLDLEYGGYAHPCPQRVVLADGGHHYHPLAGGSPFITCHNCFELLKLPKKLLPSGRGQWRICCGACSTVISLSVVDSKLVVVGPPKNRTLKEVLDSSDEVVYEKPYQSCSAALKLDGSSFRSEDYDMSGYDFKSADKELVSVANCNGLNSVKSEELPNVCPLSPSTSEDEDSQHGLNTGHDVANSIEMPAKAGLSHSTSTFPMENVGDSSKYRLVNRCGKGSLSSRSDQERASPNKCILRQNSLKDSTATEMEISDNDFPYPRVTQDSMDVIKEDDQPRGRKGIDAFFAGLIKKSFRDFSRSSHALENGKRHVTVNGHAIPERLIRKGEKLAGPICSGQYWYDYRAGFWGVMFGPCLGIIPPFIEEFNYPMPESCAGGTTGVFVNGRELHQKDLDLLASRGLPVTRERSYIIEISGRVVDEDSGEELDSLGRLAPTIEKVKQGFGMRVPKEAA